MIPYGMTLQLYQSYEFLDDEPLTIVGKPFVNSRQEMECINLSDIDEEFDRAV